MRPEDKNKSLSEEEGEGRRRVRKAFGDEM